MNRRELWNRIQTEWPDLALFLTELRQEFGKVNLLNVEFAKEKP